ncbi:hypothetical protein AAHA92_06985 [Salvia divinorum]|uniref:Uncharacterized protein n=1 Tax=Salvia divinorum TaxID=28513 RepID=A0ABD1I9U6_SALDI
MLPNTLFRLAKTLLHRLQIVCWNYKLWLTRNLPLKEYQACSKRIQGTNTVRDSTLITGAVLTIALLLSYFRILNNQ